MLIYNRGAAKPKNVTGKARAKFTKMLNEARKRWQTIAKESGWSRDPFYVQIWVNQDDLSLTDSLYATKEATDDIVIIEKPCGCYEFDCDCYNTPLKEISL